MFEKLTNFLNGFLELGVPGYDCIVLHNGNCVYRHMNGYSNREAQIPVSGKERYHIYSCTKPITCVAVLQLCEKGLLQLEDELSTFLPEFETMYIKTDEGLKKAENRIRIKHLLSMTAGLSYEINWEKIQQIKEKTNEKCPTRAMMEWPAEAPLLFEPGERFYYGLCHDVLAAVVEVVTGERFSDYVKKNIFDPLGMTHSTFHLSDDEMDSMAEQYVHNWQEKTTKNCGKQNEWEFGPDYDSGGGGCISTVEDMARFAEALRIGDVILKSETIDRMATNLLAEHQRKELWCENYGYGLGVRCPKDETRTDFGWYGAAGAYLAVDRKNQISVYYAQHVLTNPNGGYLLEIIELVKEALGCAG